MQVPAVASGAVTFVAAVDEVGLAERVKIVLRLASSYLMNEKPLDLFVTLPRCHQSRSADSSRVFIPFGS